MTRKTLRRICLVLGVLVMASASGANLRANRGYSSQLYFFSSPAMTSQVGEGDIDCTWHFTLLWGTQTSYYESFNDSCDGPTTWYGCASMNAPYCPTGWSCQPGGECDQSGQCTSDSQCAPNGHCFSGYCH